MSWPESFIRWLYEPAKVWELLLAIGIIAAAWVRPIRKFLKW